MYAENIEDAYNKEHEYYDTLHAKKYRDKNQTKDQHKRKLASSICSTELHAFEIYKILRAERFLPAGRIQAALGAVEREVSPFNCSVSQKIGDSIDDIYSAIHKAAKILRLGTGIGYNFSHLRPKGALVKKLQSLASGPLSYMRIFNESAACIASAGHRRGAQMGIMNVSHPDIEEFIDAKLEKGAFTYFNLSVGITEDFMLCVKNDADWELSFGGEVYKTIRAKHLWERIVTNAFNSAEPGVVFLDKMNEMNNLWYCEEIEATNPCSEQPLPPYGLCTLGSFNLTQYLGVDDTGRFQFNYDLFKDDIHTIVEAYDNVFDNAVYAIPEHKTEALDKRRIGLGLTGIANAIELMVGRPSYGESEFNFHLNQICMVLAVESYKASIELAKKRGPFPLYSPEEFAKSKFLTGMPREVTDAIYEHGIRNSHLISYAPCGTISQCAGNVSSGVEPIFYHHVDRDVIMPEGKINVTLTDWAFREFSFKGKTLEECTVDQHLKVAEICQRWCDSAVSKTINVAADCSYEEYSKTYMRAYELGLKGVTVFRPTELRGAVITKSEDKGETPMETTEASNTAEYNTFTCASGVCER